MHPNWKALATVHIPYKVFVTEGHSDKEKEKRPKSQLLNIGSGNEIKNYYEGIIGESSQANNNKKVPERKQKLPAQKRSDLIKKPFDEKILFNAAIKNDVESINNLELIGNNINSVDQFGWTAVMMAACAGATDSFEWLLENGADITVRDKKGFDAISLAQKKNRFEILEIYRNFFVRNQALTINLSEDDHSSKAPFHCAVCNIEFKETSRTEHETSTLHKFHETSNISFRRRYAIPDSNRGFQLMVKQGWDKEHGLGPREQGHMYPIKTVIRKRRTGLGIEQEPSRVTHFGAFDARAILYKDPLPRAKTRKDINRDFLKEKRKERNIRKQLS